ncbi:MAG: SPW repeat protein [Solirubrobacteraceae bacterium]
MAIRDPRIRRPRSGPIPRRREPLHNDEPYSTDFEPSPPPPPNERREIALLSALNVLAGAWLVIAPWVLGYWSSDPRWNDVACGAAVSLVALISLAGAFRASWLSWINAVIGAWVFVAAFTIDRSAVAAWNDAIVGAVIFLLAAASADATRRLVPRRPTPRPWGM